MAADIGFCMYTFYIGRTSKRFIVTHAIANEDDTAKEGVGVSGGGAGKVGNPSVAS